MQNSKCKIKEVIAAKPQFRYFGTLNLTFDLFLERDRDEGDSRF
jgi:hypothetical protein